MSRGRLKRLEKLKRRFERLVFLTLHCRIVTPMFLGDAEQKAALRPEPFKALLRYWWRVAAGWKYAAPKKLLEDESRIFGGGGDEAQKSLVTMGVEGNPRVIEDSRLPKVQDVYHPEVGRSGRRINPLLYLGYGPVLWKQGQARYDRPYLEPGENFSLKITFPESLVEDETFKLAFLYFCAFGAVGSRSRNGWGSFQVEKIEPGGLKEQILPEKVACLPLKKDLFGHKDYPHSLALDPKRKSKKSLIWRTKNFRNSWAEVMKDLAEIYISIRTKLSPDGRDDIDERHLLGFPLTRHTANSAPNWGPRARHASALRFFVRKKKDGYCGLILHLPFGLSRTMRKNAAGREFFTPEKQLEIWQKVHQRLDQTMTRASINECL